MRLASVITLAILALDCVVTLELETRSACFLLKSKNFDLQFLKLLGDRLLDTLALLQLLSKDPKATSEPSKLGRGKGVERKIVNAILTELLWFCAFSR